MRASATVVNRLALGAGGLVLLAAGAWAALTGFPLAPAPPSWWPEPPGGVLLAADRLARLRGEGWWAPSVTAAATALAVLFGCAAAGQFRRGGRGPVRLAAPGATLRPGALAEALALRAAAVPGVARSRARVVPRSRRRLEVRWRVWLDPGTAPDEVLPTLCALAAEAEASAAPYTARTRLRLSAASHRTPHVS